MATPPTAHTWTVGDFATQANMQTVSDAALWSTGRTTSTGIRKPLALLRQTVGQTILNGAVTEVTMDTEDVDYDGGHSTVTNTQRYTAPTAGWYHVSAVGAFAANATGERYVGISKNGTVQSAARSNANATAGVPTVLTVSTLVFLNGTTDWVSLSVYQASGGSLNTQVGTLDNSSRLSIMWVSV